MARFKDIRAVVLGMELNGLAVVRALGRKRVGVVGIDSDLDQVSALSKYVLTRIKTDDIRGPSVIDTLNRMSSGPQRYVLFPTMDATVLVLSEERERLQGNMILRLPDKETVRRLMHKGSFRELCKASDLPTPGSAVAKDVEELEAGLGRLRLPVVMKSTLKKMEGVKAVVVEDVNQGVAAYREQGEGEVILEEWIPGGDGDVYFCLQAYSKSSELLASFVGRKIRQWPPLIGGTASAEPVDVPELEETTTRFFKAVKFQGICSMEYKFDARDGQYYFIEPTVGRTDYQSGIATANGVNIPFLTFADIAGEAVKKPKPWRGMKWVDPVADERAAMHYMERGELTRSEWKSSLRGPRMSTLYAFDDPGPWVSDVFRRIVGRLKRTFGMERS